MPRDPGARDVRPILRRISLAILLASVIGCSPPEPPAPAPTASPSRPPGGEAPAATRRRPDAATPQPARPEAGGPGEWHMPGRDFAGTRFAPLDQIDNGNVDGLQVAFTFSTGLARGHEAAPLVVGGTMYLVAPFPNTLFALDLTRPGAPMKWRFDPDPVPAAQGVACCDVVNRGAVYADGKIFYNTLDGHALAVDAETGELRWKTLLGDINRGETITMAPLVVDGKVLVGNSGGELGVRGWITALDAASGEIAWRAYSTGPDEDVLIGPDFAPFYAKDRGEDLGVASWPPDAWRTGGGTVWGWLTYDPELDLLYHGTGNPGPWNPDQRPGDNKWTAGIFARRPADGRAVWAYQWSPHDHHDYDGVNESLVLDLPIDGERRRVLVHPERNGYVYVLDRATGEVLSAEPFVHITTSTGVDLETGELLTVEAKKTGAGRLVRDICPASPGAKDWQPSGYSPRTGLLYIPHNNLCMDFEGMEASYIAGTPFVGANVRMYAGPGGHRGLLTAWDPVAGRPVWRIEESFPVWSGVVVTSGDLVFYGTMDGWFKAVDARTGELRWRFKVGSGIVGQPISYLGPDGRQYVAVFSGVGGWAGAVVAAELDVRDPTAGLGFVNAMKDLPEHTTAGGMLYAFALP
ncbi:MAG TPA: methanol/ethanol family PQQ-dependent dehydrogenase [Thermoanaerobaculia bacterium]|nr:methanol/ethanol family PQQ-dependent dehydrogenase [Thermoanaerobaculia bacterium]